MLLQSFIHNPILLKLIFSLIILIIVMTTKYFFSSLIIKGLSTIKIKQITLEITLFEHLRKPLNYLLSTFGIYLALVVSPFVYFNVTTKQILTLGHLDIPISIISIGFINKLFIAVFILLITWLVYTLEQLYESFFMELNTKLSLTDNTVIIRYLSRILSFVTLAMGIAATLIWLIPDFAGIVTGVGIGGVAVAYVAKDSLASMFSGMILLLDKPFVIGDWIAVSEIEGIVEDISFRSTRIRTFDQGLVVMPNNTIGNANITNWSRMKKRRVTFELGVSYQTTNQQIQVLTKEIKKYLDNHPYIENHTSLVHFTNMGDYALNIQIIYYSLNIDLSSYLTLKEEVNLAIITLCQKNGIDIAFPTQTILMPHH